MNRGRSAVVAIALGACAVACSPAREPATTTVPLERAARRARSEAWSMHGRLQTPGGRRFAFQAAFFRYPLSEREAASAAEFALLDEATGATVAAGRTVRDGIRREFRHFTGIKTDDWYVHSVSTHDVGHERFSVRLRTPGGEIVLTLAPTKAPTPSPAYSGYAFTRLRATGFVATAGKRYAAFGTAWLDREYGFDAGDGERATQRFELQLTDGRDVELFSTRRSDGRYRVASADRRYELRRPAMSPYGPTVPVGGIVVDRGGGVQRLDPDAVTVAIQGNARWHSPHEPVTYPALWRVTVRGAIEPLALEPVLRDQEVVPPASGVPVWRGGVDLAEADPPGSLRGNGLVELTGFATGG